QVWGDWLMRRAAAADHDVELYGRAAGHYRRYIDMVGPDPESSFSLGNALTWLDDYKGAVAAYREWVDVSYRVGPCHRNLAEFGCDGGESVLAASMMLQLLDTREYAADVPELLADSFDNIDGTDDPDGVRALLKVLDRIGDAAPPDLQLKRGQALLELDDMPAARAFWISVLQGLWADDNARQQAMRMLVYNEGASDLLRALGGLPEKPVGAWYYAGLAHNKLGDAAAAREAFVAGFRTGDAPDLRNAALRQLNFMNRPDDVVSLLTALPVGQRPAACWNAHFDALRKLQRRSDIPAAAREYAADPSIPAEDVIDMLDSVIKVPGGADAVINLLAGWSANRSDEPGAIATVTRGDALLHLGREREALDLWAACALDSAADEQVRGTALARIRQRQQWELLGSVVQKLTDNASTLDSSVERYLVLRHAGKTEEAGELAMTCARDSKQWQCAAWLRRAIACNQPRRVLRFLEFAADQVSNANPSWIKAQASAATGKPSDALPLYRAALRASSGGTPPGILDVPGGPEMVIEEIDAMPSEQREQFRGLASNALCKLRQFDEASRIWSDLLAKADTYGWQRESALRALLGVQLEADPARAIATAKAAMQKEPDDLDLQIRLAILYVRAGKIAEAGALLDEMRRADDERITTLATWRTWDDSWDDVRVLWNQPELGPRLKKWYLDVTGGKLSLLPHDDLD
ncbi:MAG: tetratricopeptide repeat protein, partial [Planctomycetota bacterium]